MLDFLEQKKVELEAQKVEPTAVYEDLDKKVEEYKSELYKARWTEIVEKNKLIDVKVAFLDELIAEAKLPKEEEVVLAEVVEETAAEELPVSEADEAPVIHYSKSV